VTASKGPDGLLHAAGFFPLNGLVSDVTMALEGVKR
jgi:hypothetical protein